MIRGLYAVSIMATSGALVDPGGCRGEVVPVGIDTHDAASEASGAEAAAGSCTLDRSAYDQSCQVDSDCLGVFLGNACNDVCNGECVNAGINVNASARYQADFAAIPATPHHSACSCALGPQACCRSGVCDPHCAAPVDAGVVGSDGSAGCSVPPNPAAATYDCEAGANGVCAPWKAAQGTPPLYPPGCHVSTPLMQVPAWGCTSLTCTCEPFPLGDGGWTYTFVCPL
jgi:hypothetical protein